MTGARPGAELRFYRAAGKHGFLSNLHRCPVLFEDRLFPSAEHAYQFGKPVDAAVAEWLAHAPGPRHAAVAAHALLPYDVRPEWAAVKLDRMRRVLGVKFTQNPALAIDLLDTGDAVLVEDSKTDAYWGLGKKGTGQNMLGYLLTETRRGLRMGVLVPWSTDPAYHGEGAPEMDPDGHAIRGGYRGPDGVHRCGACADQRGLQRAHYHVTVHGNSALDAFNGSVTVRRRNQRGLRGRR